MRESLSVSYLNPIQVRHNGVIVDDIPKHLAPDPEKATHSLYFPQHDLQIPLQWKGVISRLPVHYPSTPELEICTWIELTAAEEWDPHSDDFAKKEAKIEENLSSIQISSHNRIIKEIHMESMTEYNSTTYCYSMINQTVKIGATYSNSRKFTEALRNKVSHIFGVGLDTAD